MVKTAFYLGTARARLGWALIILIQTGFFGSWGWGGVGDWVGVSVWVGVGWGGGESILQRNPFKLNSCKSQK